MNDDLTQIDIAPEIPLPACKEWQALGLLRMALEQPAGTRWDYELPIVRLIVNETGLDVPVGKGVTLELGPRSAVLLRNGFGIIAIIREARAAFMRQGNGEAVLAAIIEETCRERADIVRRASARPLFAGQAVCESCGVLLGEFPGDRFNNDRTGGVCEQCLTFGPRAWLNKEPRRDWRRT